MYKLPSLRELLEAGVHFGHKTARWHPKMKNYIFMSKNGVHVINLEKTEEELKKATDFLAGLASDGKKIVFVGTKKQASAIIKQAAIDCGMPYVNARWIGGTLTNFVTVKAAITNFIKIKEQVENEAETLSKKELSKLRDKVAKGEKIFGGLVSLEKKPDAMIVIGAHDEPNAVREALIENVPIIAVMDTNADPAGIKFPIPANDDATKSIQLFAELFSKVIKENKKITKE